MLRMGVLGVAVVGLLCAGVFGVHCALLARKLPDLPLHMRINPFNVLASRDLWTPEIVRYERLAARSVLVFIVGVLMFVGLSVVGP